MRYRNPRAACAYQTRIDHAGGRSAVLIRDVSSAGACAELSPSALRPGDVITLWVMERPLTAEVRWTRRAELGLRFARPLTPRDMAVIRHQSRIVPAAGCARRGVHGFAEL